VFTSQLFDFFPLYKSLLMPYSVHTKSYVTIRYKLRQNYAHSYLVNRKFLSGKTKTEKQVKKKQKKLAYP